MRTEKGKAACARAAADYQKRHGYRMRLKREYGITLEEYERLLVQQNGVCAICRRPPAPGKRLVVDHDHKRKRVRGLLHPNCNTALGLMDDDPARLRAGASYLEEHSAKM